MKAVIVAAGRGKRLMPLTANTPKPLIPVQGTPLLDYLLRGLKWSGITDVIIVVRYLGEKIEEAYGDGSSIGMHIEYAYQEGLSGTGSALLAVEGKTGSEPFLLMWGDVLSNPENYKRIQELYAENPCDLFSDLNWMDDPSTGASVTMDDTHILAIQEKPEPGAAPTHWNQAGLFICKESVFQAMRDSGVSPRGEIEFTGGVQVLLDNGAEVRYMRHDGFWSDVGTIELLDRLNADPKVSALLR